MSDVDAELLGDTRIDALVLKLVVRETVATASTKANNETLGVTELVSEEVAASELEMFGLLVPGSEAKALNNTQADGEVRPETDGATLAPVALDSATLAPAAMDSATLALAAIDGVTLALAVMDVVTLGKIGAVRESEALGDTLGDTKGGRRALVDSRADEGGCWEGSHDKDAGSDTGRRRDRCRRFGRE